jgi:pyridoxamine 5'-phosphate oxidase
MIAAMARRTGDPIAKFSRWLDDARFVLLKGIDQRGFVFFTDARSRKGRDLRVNPRAALAFYWQPKGRQVRVEGRVEAVTREENDAYWPTRPRASQLAANASYQSARLRSRAGLLTRVVQLNRKFKLQDVPRPHYWTGFRVRPDAIEFWTHREHRLHHREIYRRRGNGWRCELLQP